MDPATIALTAAGLLAKKALEAAAGKAGEGAWAALGRIADAVRRRFSGDPEVTVTSLAALGRWARRNAAASAA